MWGDADVFSLTLIVAIISFGVGAVLGNFATRCVGVSGYRPRSLSAAINDECRASLPGSAVRASARSAAGPG
jgi:hypothetical protein